MVRREVITVCPENRIKTGRRVAKTQIFLMLQQVLCTVVTVLCRIKGMIPIRQFIYHLTDKFFVSCPAHPNPLIRNTGNYTLEDLRRQYTKYRHKHIKHILL